MTAVWSGYIRAELARDLHPRKLVEFRDKRKKEGFFLGTLLAPPPFLSFRSLQPFVKADLEPQGEGEREGKFLEVTEKEEEGGGLSKQAATVDKYRTQLRFKLIEGEGKWSVCVC